MQLSALCAAARALGVAVIDAPEATSRPAGQRTTNPSTPPAHKARKAAPRTAAGATRAKMMRASRGSARQEAGRLGAVVGNGCDGRAAMQRNERQWVVLCSNGKTYVVEPPSPQASGAPPSECSLSAKDGEPACFAW
jgi:hypothetical protein